MDRGFGLADLYICRIGGVNCGYGAYLGGVGGRTANLWIGADVGKLHAYPGCMNIVSCEYLFRVLSRW